MFNSFSRFLLVLSLSGTVQKNPGEAKKRATDFTQSTVEVKGDYEKSEQITKALKFVMYD